MTPKFILKFSLLPIAILAPALAFAHPIKPETKTEASVDVSAPVIDGELSEKIDEKLSKHKLRIAKSAARLKRDLDKNQKTSNGDVTEDLEAVADIFQDVFAEEGLFRDVVAMFGDFADDIEVDTDDGTTVLRFDGATVGKIETHKSRDSEDSISISGLGKNLTLDRETIVKDGKSKTRIIIEMDGEDSIDITLPQID